MSNNQHMTSFLKALSSHERWLAGYVQTLIPNSADADDVLQEIKLALWENYEQFEEGTSFSAWSKQVAFYRALAFRQKKAIENKRMVFSPECYELLDKHYEQDVKSISQETKRLRKCLSHLPIRINLRCKSFKINELNCN